MSTPNASRLRKVTVFFKERAPDVSPPARIDILKRDGVRVTRLGRDFYAREADLERWWARQTATLDA